MGMMDSGIAGFLQGTVSGMDRARDRKRQAEMDKRQAQKDALAEQFTRLQMDIARQNRAMQESKMSQLENQRKADAWIYQNPGNGMMAAAGAGDNWARGFGGGPDLTAASPEAYKWAYEQSNPKPAKLTGTLGNLKAMYPDASPQELLGMAMSMSRAGASKTTVNTGSFTDGRPVVNKPETGYQYIWDEANNTWKAEPIPGGSVARGDDAKAVADANAAKTQSTYADVVTGSIDRAFDLIDNSGTPTTGFWGSSLADVPGTAAHDLQQAIAAIESNVGFDRLQQMRDASPTGGALGQVSEKELALLTGALGSLKQSQTQEQLRSNLANVKRIYNQIVNGVDVPDGNPWTGGNDAANDADTEADRLIQQYGGAR
jgi:hypothetical protein